MEPVVYCPLCAKPAAAIDTKPKLLDGSFVVVVFCKRGLDEGCGVTRLLLAYDHYEKVRYGK